MLILELPSFDRQEIVGGGHIIGSWTVAMVLGFFVPR